MYKRSSKLYNCNIEITFFNSEDEKIMDNCFKIFQHFHNYSNRFENYDGIFNINDFNNAPIGSYHLKFPILAQIKIAKFYNSTVSKNFDITLAKYSNDFLSGKELKKYNTGMDKLIVKDNLVTKTTDDVCLDLGAIAKSYASKHVADYLQRKHITALINAGGTIKTVNQLPNNEKWHFGIQNPQNLETNLLVVETKPFEAASTSASYIQNKNGFTHIINPTMIDNGAKSVISVTVFNEDVIFCDVISTILFTMSFNQAKKFAKKNNIKAIWIFDNYQYFTNLNKELIYEI